MTKYIDKHDAIAIRRKFVCEFRARADAVVKAAAPAVLGASDDEARAVLNRMMRGLVLEIDELERQVLRDLDALTSRLKVEE